MIKTIATKIAELTASFTIGTNLLVGFRPLEAIDRCSVILESGPGGYPELPDRADAMIQIISRSGKEPTGSIWDARADAHEIHDAIHGTFGWDMTPVAGEGTLKAMTVEKVSGPAYMGIDDKGRHEFSTNYLWRIQDR